MKDSDALFVIFIAMFVVAVLILMPFAQIWAINTLFGLHIPYSLKNWFAIVILSCFWLRIPSVSRKKD